MSQAPGEYLLEVRSEEIPARMLGPGLHELATRLFEELMARGLGPRQVETGYTPRRLVLALSGLPEKEPDREEQVLGPPVRAAYTKDGEPTPAFHGFAKKCGLPPEALRKVSTEKGEYLGATVKTAGRPTVTILSELVPLLLSEISWAKTMRWGHGGKDRGPWVRPVHGIVSLLDGQVVPFTFFGVAAGDTTEGHPVLSPEPFQVTGLADYRQQLGARHIEVRPAERRATLHAGMAERAAAAGGTLVEDMALLDKLVAICEIPGVMEGGFDEEFLELPAEVLSTSLRDHQSALTVKKAGGAGGNYRLLPRFLTVMDRPDDPAGRVRSGNEWVVAARLADARFFFHEDRKISLSSRAEQLWSLTFDVKLGSYKQKSERLEWLSEEICTLLGWHAERTAAIAAAQLMKVDLATAVVKEFTSLQGIMGGVYARLEGAPDEVWQAIYDQYLPASTEDRIPRGRIGQVVSLADRLDTLAGIFGLGLVPTGSRDPFGLRRAAQGVVRIALEGDLSFDIEEAVAKAVVFYQKQGANLSRTPQRVQDDLRPFLADRLRYVLGLAGYAYDEIEAGLAVGAANLPDLKARVDALHKARTGTDFLSVVLAAKRIANIVKDAPESPLDVALLSEPAEKDLGLTFFDMRAGIEEAASERDYERCLARIAELAPVLDRFFVEVLVMDEDPAVRANRIALLQAIGRTVSRTARLTEMVVDRTEHRARTEGGAAT